jgi:hypothetical protein
MGDGGHTVAQVHRALAKEIAMARKRASLKGKGQAILLGEEMAEESPTVSASETETPSEVGKEAPSEALTAEEGEEVDWSGMLEDEVATAEPPAEGEAPRPLPAIEYYYPEEESAEPKAGLPTIAQPSPAPVSPVAPATPVPAEPQLASPPSAEAEAFPPEVDAHGVDWSSMLEDEVATAAPPAGEAVVTPPPPIEYYYPEEESAVVEPERPAVVEPVEPQLAAMAQPPPSPAAGQPPSEALTSAPRIRIGGLLAGVPLTEVAEVPPPGPGLEEVRVRETTRPPPRELTDEEEEIVIKRASRKHRRELYDRISQLYRDVPSELSSSGLRGEREEALLLLSEARDIVLEEPRQFDEAEHKVGQVEGIIANAQDVEKWSHYYGNRLIVYLVTWFVLLITGIVFISPLSAWLETLTFGTASGVPPVIVAPLLFTMLWGGIGGVVGGLYSLWRKIDIFDKQYTVWYTLQPVSGLVLGGIVHVIIMTGFLSMSIQTSGAGGPTVQETQAVQWFPALLAVAFGFRQNNFYALLDRIIRLIGQPREESQQSGAST